MFSDLGQVMLDNLQVPQLILVNKKGIINNRGTHLDLLPTILSLIENKPEDIST
jgi:hypothetical protein